VGRAKRVLALGVNNKSDVVPTRRGPAGVGNPGRAGGRGGPGRPRRGPGALDGEPAWSDAGGRAMADAYVPARRRTLIAPLGGRLPATRARVLRDG